MEQKLCGIIDFMAGRVYHWGFLPAVIVGRASLGGPRAGARGDHCRRVAATALQVCLAPKAQVTWKGAFATERGVNSGGGVRGDL